jgi:hypothetical protein
MTILVNSIVVGMVSTSPFSANTAILAPSCPLHQFSSLYGAHGGKKEGKVEPIPTTEKVWYSLLTLTSYMIYLQNESKGIFLCSLFNIKYF